MCCDAVGLFAVCIVYVDAYVCKAGVNIMYLVEVLKHSLL